METRKRSTQSGAEELLSLLGIAHLLTSRRTFEEKMQDVVEELAKVTDASEVVLRLVTEEPPGLRRIASAGPYASDDLPPEILPLNMGLSASVIKERQVVVSNDYAQDRRAAPALVIRGTKSVAALPIFAGESLIGTLILASRETNQFPDSRVEYLSEVVAVLNPLVHNARLQEQEQLRVEELEALTATMRAFANPGDYTEKLRRALEEIARVSEAPHILVRELTEDNTGWRVSVRAGVPAESIPVGMEVIPADEGLVGLAFKAGEAVVSDDTQSDPRLSSEYRSYAMTIDIVSAVALPIKTDEKIIGIFLLGAPDPAHFTSRRVAMLETVADGLGPLLENARLQEQDKLRAEETDALFSLAKALSESGTFDERATKFVSQLETILGVDLVALRLLDKEGYLRLVAASGPVMARNALTLLLPTDRGLLGDAFKQNRLVVSNDYQTDPHALPSVKEWGTRSVLAVPVAAGDRVLGAIVVSDLTPDYFNPRRIDLVQAIADGIGVLLQNARLQEEEQLRVEELEALSVVSSAIATSGTFRGRISYAMERLAGIFTDATFVLWLGNEANDGVRFVVGGGPRSAIVAAIHHFIPAGEGAVGVALQTNELVLSNDYATYPHAWTPSVDAGIHSVLALPVRVTDRVSSVLGITSSESDYFTPRRVRVLTAVAEGLTALIENARLAGQLQLLAVDISAREQQVLDYAADGLTNRMIARRLGVSENTIKFHMKNLMAKLEIRSRRDLRRR